ncbi:alpha/beta hydrolase [Synoicihabitans lomoniglobus]|uniref:Alpha/beta hydrolase n=1 Tax=Synoicihabitans lomoniglobus TaxID=2909285 RepID=A0AAF0I5U7_9BACT|nr:alpha/beta hydrolase [Opitutaceae bacterium LMO-M01]WED67215.1 alpha/beta hydrolase [Opitutaceae bacterium LMO-M01]
MRVFSAPLRICGGSPYHAALTLATLASLAINLAATSPTYPGAETHVYREAEPEPVRLHVFKPEGWKPSDQRPAYVRFFGGGWLHGSPDKSVGPARDAARQGMVGIAPDYRVKERWPAADATWSVADARRAVHWVQTHAAELGVDPAKIIVAGTSAGAHLALWTALHTTPAGLDPADAPAPPLAALILHCPPSDTSARTGVGSSRFHSPRPDDFSPFHHLDTVIPPVLLIHGDADALVPYAQSVALHQALIDSGNTCEFYTVPGGGHNYAGDVPSWKSKVPRLQQTFLENLNLLPVRP